MEQLLLHTCCAPCSVACVQALRAEGLAPTAYWLNPNIHPFTEYRARRDALTEYAKAVDMPLVMEDQYGLRAFLTATDASTDYDDARCGICYTMRLEQAAAYAAANGFQAFSTTLLISPYQRHSLIRQIGEQAAASHNITFLYRDFRPIFRDGQREARAMGLYMQKYCGCIYSEEERYLKPRSGA